MMPDSDLGGSQLLAQQSHSKETATTPRTPIAIVGGTAGLGFGLAVRLAHLGESVLIGSRQAEKAVLAVDEARSKVAEGAIEGGANPEVVADASLVVVTVPFPGQAATYKAIKPALKEGALVLDCTVPLASEVGGKPTRMLGVWEGSAAQQAKGILGKDIKLASGFHTVMSDVLEEVTEPVDQDILLCGDADVKEFVSGLISKIPGAKYVDCGGLENARILESLTALLIGINSRYKLHPGAGIRIAGLPETD